MPSEAAKTPYKRCASLEMRFKMAEKEKKEPESPTPNEAARAQAQGRVAERRGDAPPSSPAPVGLSVGEGVRAGAGTEEETFYVVLAGSVGGWKRGDVISDKKNSDGSPPFDKDWLISQEAIRPATALEAGQKKVLLEDSEVTKGMPQTSVTESNAQLRRQNKELQEQLAISNSRLQNAENAPPPETYQPQQSRAFQELIAEKDSALKKAIEQNKHLMAENDRLKDQLNAKKK